MHVLYDELVKTLAANPNYSVKDLGTTLSESFVDDLISFLSADGRFTETDAEKEAKSVISMIATDVFDHQRIIEAENDKGGGELGKRTR